MIEITLPPVKTMMSAFLAADASFDGVFMTAVKTTGIYCRPSCSARKPKPENVEFYASARDATFAGYRPCKRCRPLEQPGSVPDWLTPLLAQVEQDPAKKWRDRDIRNLGLAPERVRRWFLANHEMTFHAYSRSRRLGVALGRIQNGDQVTRAAFDSGYESLSGFGDAFRGLFGEPPGQAADATIITVARIATPLGPMVAGATTGTAADAVCLLEFVDRRMLETQLTRLRSRLRAHMAPGRTPLLDQLRGELSEYFAGTRSRFDVPLNLPGTEFQKTVWDALMKIPSGETCSYSELAANLGRPDAARAVAKANGDNRIAIIVPCHRVIGKDGKLTGYGGGLWRKQKLLDHEREVGAQATI